MRMPSDGTTLSQRNKYAGELCQHLGMVGNRHWSVYREDLANEEPPENNERNSQDQYPNPEGLTVRGFLRLSLEMSLGTHHFLDLFRRVFWRKSRLNPHLVIPKINPQFGLTH
jgi:hypothetical protein